MRIDASDSKLAARELAENEQTIYSKYPDTNIKHDFVRAPFSSRGGGSPRIIRLHDPRQERNS
jgi:hypothetical protein